MALNNTAGSQSAISFLNTSTAKWRIGNTATNTFDIYNFSLSTNAISIDNAINTVKFDQYLLIRQGLLSNFISGYNSIGGNSNGFYLILGTSTNTAYLDMSSLSAARSFTFPNANGTIALTSNLSSYLPLTGGTLTGALTVNVGGGLPALNIGNSSLSAKTWTLIPTTNGVDSDLAFYYTGTTSGTKVTFANNGKVGIGVASPTVALDVLGEGKFSSALTSVGLNASGAIALTPSTFAVGSSTATDSNALTCQAANSNYFLKFLNAAGTSLGGFYYDGTNFIADSQNYKFINAVTTNSTLTSKTGNSGTAFNSNSATTGYNIGYRGSNTTGVYFLGVEGTAAGTLVTNNTAYSTNLTTASATDLVLGTNQVARLTIGSTGTATFTGAVNGLSFTANSGTGAFYGSEFTFPNPTLPTRLSIYLTGGSITLYNSAVGNIGQFNSTTGVYTPLSDINKKKDFEDSTIGLNAILGLKPTLFRMLDEENTDKHLGFIAQEVKEIIPQAYVESGEGENVFIGLDFQAITTTLVKAMQEQQSIINGLLQRIELLENK